MREAEEQLMQERHRRPSRFEVIPAPDVAALREIANNEMLPAQQKKLSTLTSPIFGSKPKSILKKTNSFTMKGSSPLSPHSPMMTPYSTITGGESRIRSAFDIIFRKSTTLADVTPDPELGSIGTPSIGGMDSAPISPGVSKKVQLPRERVIDMSPEDQKIWEMEEMDREINLEASNIHIDPAPFQLVERTSLLKVHSLFSMVGINHAYVTKIGKLVGVVGLKEVSGSWRVLREDIILKLSVCSQQLRKAIEEVNSGTFVMPEDGDPESRDKDKERPGEDAPLLTSDQKTQNMISAMKTDSIELDNGTPKKLTINSNTNNNNNSNNSSSSTANQNGNSKSS